MLAYFECFWTYSCHWDSQGNKLLGSWGIIYCKAKGIPFFSTCLQILRCKTTLRRLFIVVMLHIEYPIRYGFNEKPHFVILCFQYVNIEFLNPFFFLVLNCHFLKLKPIFINNFFTDRISWYMGTSYLVHKEGRLQYQV